jgi:hypothetical protein
MDLSSTLGEMFQSYQFRQINPDDAMDEISLTYYETFQSYQFRQINPDSYLWEASRGAVLRG